VVEEHEVAGLNVPMQDLVVVTLLNDTQDGSHISGRLDCPPKMA
jgi:hypothetical protein